MVKEYRGFNACVKVFIKDVRHDTSLTQHHIAAYGHQSKHT